MDCWLAERFTYHSRAEWQRLVRDACVTVNDAATKPSRILADGDRVEYHLPDIPEPPVDDTVAILFEDDDLLIVDKPGNLPCHPSGRYFRHTLWHLLRRYDPEARLVNRLDRETSGIVIAARSAEAAAALQRQFAEHTVVKTYLALVEGEFPAEAEAVGRLEPDPESAVAKKQRFVVGEGGGSPAVTRFARVEAAGGVSLVRCLPATGRLHQIRATLLALGFPVVGDKLYGVDERLFLAFIGDGLGASERERLRMERQALHAAGLEFTHPRTGESCTVEAPLPPDFSACLLTLGFAGRYSKPLPGSRFLT